MVTSVTVILVFDYPFTFIGVALTAPWLLSMSSPGLAGLEATTQAIVSAPYTCWGPCTRKAAR